MYRELAKIAEEENWEVKYDLLFPTSEPGLQALSMRGKWNPICIKEREFNFIKGMVQQFELKNGYELATGVGISCLAAGIPMKEYGGKIVTMDAYIEENREHSMAYIGSGPITYTKAMGLTSVEQLIKYYGLENTIYPKVGWSPDDTEKRLSEVFDLSTEKLDYVFIDGEHTDQSLLRDLKSIEPYVNQDKFIIFLHDLHAETITRKSIDYIFNTYGQEPVVCPGCEWWNGCFHLSYIGNL